MKTLTNTIELQSYYVQNQESLVSELSELLRTSFVKPFELFGFENTTGETATVKASPCYLGTFNEASLEIYMNGDKLNGGWFLSISDEGNSIELVASVYDDEETQTRIILNRIEEPLSKFSV